MGKPYRKLSRAEAEEYSVLDKIEVRRGALYYDGRRISTNRMFVIEIHGAYRWNGGILLHGYTSKLFTGIVLLHENVNELGFINPTTGVCKFILTYQKGPPWPIEFLAPITSINTANKDFIFDVRRPETVSMGEPYDLVLSLTNVSDKPLPVPEYLFGGAGIRYRASALHVPDENEGGRAEGQSREPPEPRLHGVWIWPPLKADERPEALANRRTPLGPGQTRTSALGGAGGVPIARPLQNGVFLGGLRGRGQGRDEPLRVREVDNNKAVPYQQVQRKVHLRRDGARDSVRQKADGLFHLAGQQH